MECSGYGLISLRSLPSIRQDKFHYLPGLSFHPLLYRHLETREIWSVYLPAPIVTPPQPRTIHNTRHVPTCISQPGRHPAAQGTPRLPRRPGKGKEMEHQLCAKHPLGCSVWVTSVIPHYNPMSYPLCRGGNWGAPEVGSVPQVPRMRSAEVEVMQQFGPCSPRAHCRTATDAWIRNNTRPVYKSPGPSLYCSNP